MKVSDFDIRPSFTTCRFCNRECQKKAWPYHKRACGPMAQIKLNHLVAELTGTLDILIGTASTEYLSSQLGDTKCNTLMLYFALR